MPECDTRIRSGITVDAANLINQRVNTAIGAAGTAVGPGGAAIVDYVYGDLGAPISVNPFGSNVNKSGIEAWIDTLPANTALPLAQAATKFAGLTYELWPDPRILSQTMLVNGIYIGADKLGHFMQQGYVYYNYVVGHGYSVDYVKQWGHLSESGGVLSGSFPYFNLYGLASTGVYSRADLVANLKGFEFYRWLQTNPTGTFDIRRFLDDSWSEEVNVSAYHSDIAQDVWRNLLAGTWRGTRTDVSQPGAPPKTVQVTLAPLPSTTSAPYFWPIQGTYTYPGTSGTVTGRLNGNVLHYSTMRNAWTEGPYDRAYLVYSWREGAETGKGVWDSCMTENRLKGTWGKGDSSDNGGQFDIAK